MRDYIVTHATAGADRFMPRVVRADSATEALRAVVADLHWQDRRITRARFKEFMWDLDNYGRWYCDHGAYGRDSLDVQVYDRDVWQHFECIRLNHNGKYVGHIPPRKVGAWK